jgi:hypothetical protein
MLTALSDRPFETRGVCRAFCRLLAVIVTLWSLLSAYYRESHSNSIIERLFGPVPFVLDSRF